MANPNGYAQQYLKIIEHGGDTIPTATITVGGKGRLSAELGELSLLSAFDYVLLEVARSAFEQFALNRNFGVESYLGCRIRHNTLTGMMRDGVETLIEQPQWSGLGFDDRFIEAYDQWLAAYRTQIETLRRDRLQF